MRITLFFFRGVETTISLLWVFQYELGRSGRPWTDTVDT